MQAAPVFMLIALGVINSGNRSPVELRCEGNTDFYILMFLVQGEIKITKPPIVASAAIGQV